MKTCFGHFLAFFLLAATATNLQAQSGSIDLAFGENGYVKRNIGNGGQFHGLLLQTDGKIITLGKNFSPAFKISRFQANGENDNSFGSDGTVTFLDISAYCLSGGLLPDGKIMLAFGKSPSSSNNQDELKLLRLNTDGSIDNSFGLDGSVVIPNTGILNQCAERIHVLSNGDMILIGGKAEDGNAIHVVRVKANGTLDESFAQNGVLSINLTGGLGKIMSSFQAPNRIAIATTATSLNKLSVFRIFDNGV
ncbi:MAG: hypothetical protein IT258_12295, partial [Saprospiraceae bacterium]|nr:hypothetical protein [Saprospiraceae bacterium]